MMDELGREIALQVSRTALALSREIERAAERGWLSAEQADRLITLLDADPVRALQETAEIMAEAMGGDERRSA